MNPPIHPRTTCVLCLVQNGYAYWAHVGDSRLYHFRNGQVLSRTHDHTVTEQMRIDGVITEEEMKHHPEKSRLLKAVGGPRTPTISLGAETMLARGDALLLCTDGLWEALSTEELAGFLKAGQIEEGVEEMLFAAELRMKQKADNLSAIALRWEDAITTALPLQSHGAGDADPRAMVEDSHARLAGEKSQAGKQPAGDGRKSLESTIDELEAFLARFEKH
jgi:serine/threonine protein phosphatase PrpC